jgi:hypothetical protein
MTLTPIVFALVILLFGFDSTEQVKPRNRSQISWNVDLRKLEKAMNNQINPMNAADSYLAETSQKDLAAGVLRQVAQDLRRFHGRTSRVERELYSDAYSWVISDDHTWPFSFLNVCQLLNREPINLREELLGDLSLGVFRQWARRGHRALRRFSDSLTQRFATHEESATTPANLMQTSY